MERRKSQKSRKNTVVGKNKRPGSNLATGRKYAKQKKYNARPDQKKYRAELNRYNRKKKTYGNKDGLDASHRGGKIVGFEKAKTNRARKLKSYGRNSRKK